MDADGIRVRSTAATSHWWQIYEFSADDGSGSVDKTELQAVVDEAAALNQNEYTVFTWQVLEGNLTTAQDVLDDETVTQGVIDSAQANLRRAIDRLKKADEPVEPVDPQPDLPTETLVDMVVLNGTVAAAEKLEKAGQTGYTPDTWDAFIAALNKARVLQEATGPGALASDVQEDVDQASETLWSAMKALKENPESPEESSDNDIPAVSPIPEDAKKDAPHKPTDLKRTPDTGSQLAAFAAAAGFWLLLGSGLILAARKRRV